MENSSQSNQSPLTPASGSFWTRNANMVTRLVIIAVIIIAAVAYSRNQNQVSVSNTPAGEQTAVEDADKGSITVTDKSGDNNSTVTVGGSGNSANIQVSGGTFTVTAERGNGYTHLARRALAEFLKTTGSQNLSAEHKIFIEDYLQKHLAQKTHLRTGDTVGFSENQIQQAIDEALKLTDRQIQNLRQYTSRVSGL